MKIAITGGIGSGKSVVLEICRQLGYSTFSCDEIYKEIVNTDEYIQKIQQVFPSVVENGKIDRASLANIIFRDKKARKDLNEIAHPLIMSVLLREMNACQGVCFAEVPLLFEGNFVNLFDSIIVVQRNRLARKLAIQQRNGLSDVEAEERIKVQFDYDDLKNQEYLRQINAYVLENEGGIALLSEKISLLLHQIQAS